MSKLIVVVCLLYQGLHLASSTIAPLAPSDSSRIPPMPTNEPSAMPAHVLSTVVKPVGIKNLGHTCYCSTLLQIVFLVEPLRKRLIQKKQPRNIPKTLQPVLSLDFEANSETLLKSFVFLKRVLQNMQPLKNTKMLFLLNNIKNILGTLGLSHDENQCVNEFWSNLSHTFLSKSELIIYKRQMTTHYCEVFEPNKTGTAREKRNPFTNPSFNRSTANRKLL